MKVQGERFKNLILPFEPVLRLEEIITLQQKSLLQKKDTKRNISSPSETNSRANSFFVAYYTRETMADEN